MADEFRLPCDQRRPLRPPSSAPLPYARMPPKVGDGEDDRALGLHDEEHAEGESAENRAPDVTEDDREALRPSSIRENVARSSPMNSVPRPARSPSYQAPASRASSSASARTLRRGIYRLPRRRSCTRSMTSSHGWASSGARRCAASRSSRSACCQSCSGTWPAVAAMRSHSDCTYSI